MIRRYRLQLRISYDTTQGIYKNVHLFTELPLAHPHTTTPWQRSARFSRAPCAAHAVPITRSATPPIRLITSVSAPPPAHAAPPHPQHGSNSDNPDINYPMKPMPSRCFYYTLFHYFIFSYSAIFAASMSINVQFNSVQRSITTKP